MPAICFCYSQISEAVRFCNRLRLTLTRHFEGKEYTVHAGRGNDASTIVRCYCYLAFASISNLTRMATQKKHRACSNPGDIRHAAKLSSGNACHSVPYTQACEQTICGPETPCSTAAEASRSTAETACSTYRSRDILFCRRPIASGGASV